MPSLYINQHNQLKNCLSRKTWKKHYSMYIKESFKGYVKGILKGM